MQMWLLCFQWDTSVHSSLRQARGHLFFLLYSVVHVCHRGHFQFNYGNLHRMSTFTIGTYHVMQTLRICEVFCNYTSVFVCIFTNIHNVYPLAFGLPATVLGAWLWLVVKIIEQSVEDQSEVNESCSLGPSPTPWADLGTIWAPGQPKA